MQLGRFELGERISAGGMGEVFKARVRGAEGFHKLVAVKRIYPHLASDAEYRSMFVREAKLVAGLTHPNIVQVLELGETGDDLYIVMELVQGTDLGTLLTRLIDQRQVLTPPLVAVIAFDALDALAHAHGQTDAQGNTLGIVHRDVSPQNLLVSVDGFVKLCDFGLARTAERGRTGVIGLLGKLPYLAPEQLLGERATAQSDVFSLGTVLYSLLSGTHLFPPQTPPRQVDLWNAGAAESFGESALPSATPALVQVIRRMTAVKPEGRYETAASARGAMEDYLVTASPSAARTALARLVRELGTKSEPVEISASAPRTKEWTNVLQRAGGSPNEAIATVPVPPTPFDLETSSTEARKPPMMEAEEPPRRRRTLHLPPWIRPRWIAIGAIALIALGVFAGRQMRKTQTVVLLGDIPLGPEEPALPKPEEIAIQAGESRQRSEPRRKPAPKRETAARPASAGTGFLNLNVRPWAKVTIDGQRLARTTPLLSYPLPAGDHELRLELPDGSVRVLRVNITANQTTTKVVE